MPTSVLWVVVADARHLRVLERAGPGQPWEDLAAEAAGQTVPPSRALGRDRPGRVRESVGPLRHAIEPRQDPHEALETGFAQEVAGRLAAALAAGRFDRLVLVAPPVFLGRLRAALAEPVRGRVAGTLDRDLVALPLPEIVTRLAAYDLPTA